MKRKVNRVGTSTLTVSLPSRWAKKLDLKPGDEVDVEEDNSNLTIYREKSKKERSKKIDLTKESKRYIRSQIGRLYRYGYSEIIVSYDDPELTKKIKEATNDLLGADIMDTAKNRCTIKIFPIDENEIDFDKNLVKILVTLKYMIEIVEEDIKNNEFLKEEKLTELRNNNWKLKDYIMRNAYLNKIPYEEFNVLSTILFVYEKIGTNLLGFYRMYLEGTKKGINSNKLSPIFKKLYYFIDWFIKIISKKEPVSTAKESAFRKEMRDYHIYLFNELHKDRAIDHPFLTIVYFIVELLDSSVSYLDIYKKEYDNELK